MQFPPPPPLAPLVPQMTSSKNETSFNPLIAPQTQQQQPMSLAHSTMVGQPNGMIGNNLTQQSTILMPPMMANKNTQPQYHHYQVQAHQQQQQQQQVLAGQPPNMLTQVPMSHQPHQQPQQPQQQHQQQQQQQQQQVPMTTIMIPATAAAQIQSASIQIQQAAMQAMANNPGQPQILVFMIPYMISQPPSTIPPPTIPPTPEQRSSSTNNTLQRQPSSTFSNSILRTNQQLQQQSLVAGSTSSIHNRTVSSLSNTKQESEKFYIKANFSYQATRNKMELSFQKGDILHVLDTLQNSEYALQYWLATRVKSNGKDAEKGLIPDKNRAEEIAIEQRELDLGDTSGTIGTLVNGASNSGNVLSASVGRVNFLKRRAAQRSKSLCKDNWDNVIFDIGSFKLPMYERVIFKHPGFCRPVVIFGPLADVAREKLLRDYPEKYSYPTGFNQSKDHPKVIRLKGILEVIDQGKHALLDITPSAVEKLNFVNLAPIVIFMKTDSKSIIKEFRARAAKSLDPNARDEDTLRRDGKSSRKLLEQSIKLEKTWFHVFTATLNLSTMGSEMWYRKLRETIENQQSANVWMGERKSDQKKIMNSTSVNEVLYPMPSNSSIQQATSSTITSNLNNHNTSGVMADGISGIDTLHERFNENLNITSKSTIDLLPEGTYGNRSQLRNAYAHSLAQKLARASSEPKLNGLTNNHRDDDEEDEDDDDDDDDEIIKKPFPEAFENSSSVSSSNGAASYGHGSMSGGLGNSTINYQHYPPQHQQQQQIMKSDLSLNRQQESIYSRNPMINNSSYSTGHGSSNSNYHPLPPMTSDNNGFYNQSMSTNNNNSTTNVIDLSRNHDTRGSAFQVYSDMNQNNYHYYNINKI